MKIIDNIKSIKSYSFILLLIPCGWILNWKYYYSRFISEGFDWVGLILSIVLVIFASFLFATSQYLKLKKSGIWKLFFIGYCILALYSINCTVAGQYWDQQIKKQEINTTQIDKENTAFLINSYQKDIENLQDEYNKLNDMRNKTLNDLSDLYNWKNTTKKIEDMKAVIKIELKEVKQKLEKILIENKVSAKDKDNIIMSKTLYIFYSKFFNIKEENGDEKIQFIFQLLLSIIIESIAQLSIFAYMKIKFFDQLSIFKTDKTVKIYSPVQINKNDLRLFATLVWRGIDTKQSKRLYNKTTFMNSVKKVNPHYRDDFYRTIMKTGIENKLIIHKEDGYYPASEFVNREYFIKKMSEIMNLT
jgi:hypothetical protein